MKSISVKTRLIIFLGLFAVYLAVKEKDAIFLISVAIAAISAIAADSFIIYLKEKRLLLIESSIISGLIIGFVLSSKQPFWIVALASFLAIGSKHLIRVNKKHLFNPAAFGIFLATILFGATTQWKGTYLWYIIAPFGFYFIIKIRKIELLLGYGLAALGLFSIQAIFQKVPVSNIFGYLSYFFIFVMLIEPKTTPIKLSAKYMFGIGVAVLIFIMTEIGVKFDAEVCALLIANLFVPLLDKIPERRPI